MSILIFFSPNMVLSEINEKATFMQSNYAVDSCQMYDSIEENSRWLGYEIQKDGKTFVVKMEYAESEAGELAIQTNKWKVVDAGKKIGSGQLSQGEQYEIHEEKVIASGLTSLGEVFTLLGILKR